MKKHLFPKIFALTAMSLSIGLSLGILHHQENRPMEMTHAETVAQYYSGVTDSMTGNTLKSKLNSINNSHRKRTMGYKNHRKYYQYTERLSETPSGKMYSFYTNTYINSTWDNQETWNHEHVWPKSKNGDNVEADIHMVRPASVKINSERGNSAYAASGGYDPGQYVKEYRGVAARILFYCAIADTSLSIPDSLSGAGKLSDLLKWNLEYLPKNENDTSANIALRVEYHRNETIFSRSDLQGNRNPFIDHPEYACRIWGDTNAATKEICKKNAPVEPDTPDTSEVTPEDNTPENNEHKSVTLEPWQIGLIIAGGIIAVGAITAVVVIIVIRKKRGH